MKAKKPFQKEDFVSVLLDEIKVGDYYFDQDGHLLIATVEDDLYLINEVCFKAVPRNQTQG